MTDGEPDKYDTFSRMPFIVYIRQPSVAVRDNAQISVISISKKLVSANVKFQQIQRYSRNTWKLSFTSKSAANGVIKNKFLKDVGLTAFIRRYKLSRKIVVRDIPLDMSLTEVKQAIEKKNSNIMMTSMFRLKRRDRNTNQLVESETVCLEVRGENIPESLMILRTVISVVPYVLRICLSYNCDLFGHVSKFCNKSTKCFACAEEHSSFRESSCKATTKTCINCGGNHVTADKTCPIQWHREITRVMAYNNLSYFEARRLVMKGTREEVKTPEKIHTKKFPAIP